MNAFDTPKNNETAEKRINLDLEDSLGKLVEEEGLAEVLGVNTPGLVKQKSITPERATGLKKKPTRLFQLGSVVEPEGEEH